MIRYGKSAIKEVSRTENNGKVTVKEKIEITVDDLGIPITLVGWNGQTRERTFLSKSWRKTLRHIDNKAGLSQLSHKTTNPAATTSI